MYVDKCLETAFSISWIPRAEGSMPTNEVNWVYPMPTCPPSSPLLPCTLTPNCSRSLYLAGVTPNKVWKGAHCRLWQVPGWSWGSGPSPKGRCCCKPQTLQWGLSWQRAWRKGSLTQPPAFRLLLLHSMGCKQHPGVENPEPDHDGWLLPSPCASRDVTNPLC